MDEKEEENMVLCRNNKRKLENKVKLKSLLFNLIYIFMITQISVFFSIDSAREINISTWSA